MSQGRPSFSEDFVVKIFKALSDREGESTVIFIYDTFPREE